MEVIAGKAGYMKVYQEQPLGIDCVRFVTGWMPFLSP